ncbi:zinc finger MYM-type protein 1-like [Panicum miliaceum]|uniref:Zinc finger MYM-type protein 1-like n=1 Tax=Panicum miliaceum TaxID=4540 RepID=A0A3L6Q590_PANMI|nr:zinc finger MYM-type protein 1-like [Panicum miliaceum]
MKKKSIDLRTLWDRHSKLRKIDSTSTLQPEPVTIESEVVPPVPDDPSVQPVTVGSEVQIHCVEVEHEIARNVTEPEPEVASNEPDIASIATTVTEQEQEQQQPANSTWSPTRDGDDSETEYESSEEAIYDIDLLPHDPGRRIPIKRYDVSERNSVIRGYIALGPCQPRNHNFPIRKIEGKPRRFIANWFDEFTMWQKINTTTSLHIKQTLLRTLLPQMNKIRLVICLV